MTPSAQALERAQTIIDECELASGVLSATEIRFIKAKIATAIDEAVAERDKLAVLSRDTQIALIKANAELDDARALTRLRELERDHEREWREHHATWHEHYKALCVTLRQELDVMIASNGGLTNDVLALRQRLTATQSLIDSMFREAKTSAATFTLLDLQAIADALAASREGK